ncbi:hypothetical protein PGT21_020364 [Puccinia graminis f. sp. tritici]|uniref:Uncharacterized protein n=1 Tax=Puccinia graminis f. sp. tritici TaxID=56615 RepID=A0A5B0QNL9_PUCGR|nr:hypothetical protein PGT21_020364 [Puccinia graminis f. sp. tritici]
MIKIKSCTFVAEEPPFLNKQHYKIQDSNLWSFQDHNTKPIFGHLYDIFTPGASSWLIFKGRAIASYSKQNITIFCQSPSYHTVLPPHIQSLPHALLTADLKIIDHGSKNLAVNPDVSNSCLFRFCAQSELMCINISQVNPGQVVHISAYLLNHKHGIVDIEILSLYIF